MSSTSTTDPSSNKKKKEEVIKDILSLQQTLEELFNKVEGLKEEESQLSQENEILVKYINNLMQQQSSSSTTTTTGGGICLIHSTKQSVTITSRGGQGGGEEGFKHVLNPNQKLKEKIKLTTSNYYELTAPTDLYESGYLVVISSSKLNQKKEYRKLQVNSTESLLKGFIDTTTPLTTPSVGVNSAELRILLKEKQKEKQNTKLDWVIGTLEFDSTSTPSPFLKREFHSTASTSADDDALYALPLIQHTFRPAVKQPSIIVALLFSALSLLVPWMLLVVAFTKYGWNVGKITAANGLNAFIFVGGGLLGFVYLLTMYFWKWTFFQVLSPLIMVGVMLWYSMRQVLISN